MGELRSVAATDPSLEDLLSDEALVRTGTGVTLATDVYLPDDRPLTGCPTMLLRTPYGRRGEVDRVALLARAARSAGIALVTQDVRGRGESTGAALPFVNEVADSSRTLEWLARQPWSDGTVVPYGDSYCGFTAWASAASQDESVVGVIARVVGTDVANTWLGHGDVPRVQLNLPWLDFAFGDGDVPPVEQWRTLPLADAVDLLPADLRPYLDRSLDPGLWETLSTIAADLQAARAPITHWTGWYDCLNRGAIADYLQRVRSGHRSDVLLITPTDHEFRDVSGDAPGEEHISTLMRQVGRTLRFATGAGRQPDDVVVPMGKHTRKPTVGRWFLADGDFATAGPEGGVLAVHADPIPQTFAWVDDPSDPVPTLSQWLWGALRDGLPDQSRHQVRSDVASFTTQPHTGGGATLLGEVATQVSVKSTHRRSYLVATLCDVRPDGSALPIVEGVTVVPAGEWVTSRIELGYIGHTLRPGHRLRLQLSSTSWPAYPLSPDHTQPLEVHDVIGRTGPSSFLEIVRVDELDAAYERTPRR